MGTPTYTFDFAKNVELLLIKEFWGVYNMVCQGNTSRYEVAENILKYSKFIQKGQVESCFFGLFF